MAAKFLVIIADPKYAIFDLLMNSIIKKWQQVMVEKINLSLQAEGPMYLNPGLFLSGTQYSALQTVELAHDLTKGRVPDRWEELDIAKVLQEEGVDASFHRLDEYLRNTPTQGVVLVTDVATARFMAQLVAGKMEFYNNNIPFTSSPYQGFMLNLVNKQSVYAYTIDSRDMAKSANG